MTRICFSGLVAVVMLITPGRVFAGESVSVADMLQRSIAAYARVNDYTCLLHRRDRVKNSLKEHTTVLFKYKKPARFYMKWEKDEIEAIYAEGKYDNKMVIHGGLLFKYVSVAVDPDRALQYNRHTIRDSDIGHVLDLVQTNYLKSKSDRDAKIAFDRDEMLDGRNTRRFKAVFPEGRGYYGHKIFIHFDKELHLPIKISVYGWRGELLEEYYYENLKLNVGLTEDDFDVNNAKYLFKLGY